MAMENFLPAAVPPTDHTASRKPVGLDDPDPKFNQQQAAAYCGVSLATFRRWEREGDGPERFQRGGIIRYRRSQLDQFLARHSGPAKKVS